MCVMTNELVSIKSQKLIDNWIAISVSNLKFILIVIAFNMGT